MLVLSRKAGDEIVIDGRAAPPEVTVDRAEVHEKRQEWAEADAII
jgi:sRNA-binding carbon storage regulator CsrA